MRGRLAACVLGAILLAAGNLAADEAPTRILDFPEGQTITNAGVPLKAFTLDEYKTLATIYADYRWLWERKALADQQLTLKTQIEELYDLRVQNCQDTVKLLQADQAFWRARVTEEQAARASNARIGAVERYGLLVLTVAEAVALAVVGTRAWITAK